MGRVGRPKGKMLFNVFTIRQILETLSGGGAKNYWSVARSLPGIHSSTISRYLRFLVYNGCVERIEHSLLSVDYKITEKGWRLLEALRMLEEPPPEAIAPRPRKAR